MNGTFSVSRISFNTGPCFDAIPTYKVEVDEGCLYAYLPPTPIPVCFS